MVCMQPAAITLNYSVENIRNDVRQKIICENSKFDSLVWGSLTLAPNKHSIDELYLHPLLLDIHVCTQTNRHADRLTDRQTDRQTDGQTDMYTDG